jgi:uncharacterized protein (DUF2252 family)
VSNVGHSLVERRVMFEIDDFDETLPGPWEWAVRRLAASSGIVGRDRWFAPTRRRGTVLTGVAEPGRG